ncbi:MAG: ATP-binding protein [Planctomycetes bacterium]|nr:ATP-binding protein [Planctomycetota bacterium]
MVHVLTACVPADASYLKCIRGFVTPALERRFGTEESRQLVLAIDEACSNIIKHGQSWFTPKGTISVKLEDSKKKSVITVHNYCREKDVEKIKPRDLDDLKPGGLGTHFISEVMDTVEFVPCTEREGRMALVMTKNNSGKKNDESDD